MLDIMNRRQPENSIELPYGPVISVMLAVPDATAAAQWYTQALGATELWNMGGGVGLTVESAPFFLGEPANNGWDTPATAGTRTVRVEVFVDDPDRFIARTVAAGSVDDIRDHEAPWGVHRQGGFTHPFGHLWLVGDRSPLSTYKPR
jgi:PhnB protein